MSCIVCEFIKGGKFPHHRSRKSYKGKTCSGCQDNDFLMGTLEGEGIVRDLFWPYCYGGTLGAIAVLVSAYQCPDSIGWVGILVAWTGTAWTYIHYVHPRTCKRGTEDLRKEMFLIKVKGGK